MTKGKFPLGQIVATPNALEQLTHEDITTALARHATGDWGDCCHDDRQANDDALRDGARLFSVYHSAAGEKFWIITDAVGDNGTRESTCVLMPEDY